MSTSKLAESVQVDVKNPDIQVGVTYIFSIPPGWLVSGTVVAITQDRKRASIVDVAYLESAKSQQSPMKLWDCKHPREALELVERSWGLADGTTVLLDTLTFAVPCKVNLRVLARASEADEIKKAAR